MSLLALERVTRRFGGLVAVDDLSFTVEPGEILGIIGKNGAGKTTVFNLISGLLAPSAGRISLEGHDIGAWPAHRRARAGIARTFQVPQPLPQLTAEENVLVGALCRHDRMGTARAAAAEALARLDLGGKAATPASELTLSELKRLEIARALATGPRLLLLDEMMSGLRQREIEQTMALVRRIRDAGITVVLIEHVMYAVVGLCDRIVVIDQGRLLAEGRPAQVTADPRVVETYLGGSLAA